MQGEQDSKNETSANQYAASLKQLKLRIAEDLGLKKLPMAFGQVNPYKPTLKKFTHTKEIREQMARADMNSEKPESIPHTRMVPTDTFPLRKDHVHFNAQGQIMLGKALSKALVEASGSGK